jgi:hypothetical protein
VFLTVFVTWIHLRVWWYLWTPFQKNVFMQMHKIGMVRFTKFTNICSFSGHKLVCWQPSLLNEKLNFI